MAPGAVGNRAMLKSKSNRQLVLGCKPIEIGGVEVFHRCRLAAVVLNGMQPSLAALCSVIYAFKF